MEDEDEDFSDGSGTPEPQHAGNSEAEADASEDVGEEAPAEEQQAVICEAVQEPPAARVPGKKRQVRGSHTKEYKRLLVSYPWKKAEEVTDWRDRGRALLARLRGPPPRGLVKDEQGADIDASGVRLLSASDMAEQMIQNRLEKEGFVDKDSDEEDSGQAKKAKSSFRLREKQAKRLKIGREDIEQVAPIMEYKEVLERRAGQSSSASAALLRDRANRKDWVVANQQWHAVYVLENQVPVSPHKRWLQRIIARHTGTHTLDKDADRECCPPDLSAVPQDVARVRPEDVIITVAVCNTAGFKEQEFDVLGSQTLHELRDAFHFVGDWMYDGPTRLGSACMFIDGIFYSDMRHESSIDYSKELIEWIKVTGHPTLKEETARTMDVRICDLGTIPFGEKCCYIRQGDIEHFMYFTGARLFEPNSDCPLLEAYPCLTFMRAYRKRRCVACELRPAIWVVLDSSRCPFNPGFWCQDCFRHFFQDKNGEHIPPVDYKLFPYLHDES
eukprot:gb/GFBE01017801.1/.p1 GENE.gb/GFBE01017801.1/~~gb/GFBE01017801.1/.p1  ORF type:complete len:500 (+),score=115.73 gb/GFBE01017801.1/:1-1500(+)